MIHPQSIVAVIGWRFLVLLGGTIPLILQDCGHLEEPRGLAEARVLREGRPSLFVGRFYTQQNREDSCEFQEQIKGV